VGATSPAWILTVPSRSNLAATPEAFSAHALFEFLNFGESYLDNGYCDQLRQPFERSEFNDCEPRFQQLTISWP
jgi:hypothetical protein